MNFCYFKFFKFIEKCFLFFELLLCLAFKTACFRIKQLWEEQVSWVLVRVLQCVWVLSDWIILCESNVHWWRRQDWSLQWKREYDVRKNGKKIFNKHSDTYQYFFFRTGNYGNVKGSARPANNEGRGEFIVGFAGIPCKMCWLVVFIYLWTCLVVGNGDGGGRANYLVVDTDYDTYAIVYSCAPKLFIKKGEKKWEN